MTLSDLAALLAELSLVVGAALPIAACIRKLSAGTKCQLRSEMLRIYYHGKAQHRLRQYELENFILLYQAYKALKGNSFIDKIHKEVCSWEVET